MEALRVIVVAGARPELAQYSQLSRGRGVYHWRLEIRSGVAGLKWFQPAPGGTEFADLKPAGPGLSLQATARLNLAGLDLARAILSGLTPTCLTFAGLDLPIRDPPRLSVPRLQLTGLDLRWQW
jgi:hypothetical protein